MPLPKAGFIRDFTFQFIRRRTQRKIAQGFMYGKFPVPGINHILKEFTPEGLEHFIQSGKSVIDLWLTFIPEHLRNQALLDLEAVDVDAPAITRAIDWDQVLEWVARALPQHAEVVRRHPQWYAEECQRAISTFLKVAPTRR